MAKKHAQKKPAAPWGTERKNRNLTQPKAADAPVVGEPEQETEMAETDGLITLTKRNVQKNGIVTYAREGVNASVYFNKSMFNGEPPENVSIGAMNLRAPGEGGVGGGRSVSPEKLAERAAKAEVTAAKAQARAQKAIDKANKLKARVSGVKEPETANA